MQCRRICIYTPITIQSSIKNKLIYIAACSCGWQHPDKKRWFKETFVWFDYLELHLGIKLDKNTKFP